MRSLILAVAALAGGAQAVSLTRLAAAYNPDAQPVDPVRLINLGAGPDLDQQVNCTTAVECWGKGVVGPRSEWVKTPQNFKQSAAIQDFAEWMEMYRGDDLFNCHEAEQSALSCYVSTFLGDHDFQCSIADQGRCHIPTAEEAMRIVSLRFPTATVEEQVHAARSVYYNLKNVESIGASSWTLYNLFNEMKIEFGLKAPELVRIFTPQPDEARIAQCHFAQAVVSLPGSTTPWSPAMDILASTTGKVPGKCGNLYEVVLNKSPEKVPEVISYVIHMLDSQQEQLMSNFDKMFAYEEPNTNTPILELDYMMSRDSVVHSFRQAFFDFSDLKKESKQSMLNLFISELLTSSRCYLDCEERDDTQEVCSRSHMGGANAITQMSRVCYPKINTRCQMQCMTKKDKNNKKMPVFGIKRFAEFGIDPKRLADSSLQYYMKQGGGFQGLGMASYEAQKPVVNFALQHSEAALRLPVCWGGKRAHRIRDLNDNFNKAPNMHPLSCGWHAFETLPFLERLDVDLVKEKNYRRNQMQREIREMGPYDSFITLCNADLRFAPRGKAMHWINRGKDKRCDQVLLETMFMTDDQANLHFCTMDTVVKGVFKEEMDYIDHIHPWVDSHRKKCNNWMKKSRDICKECEDVEIEERVEKAYGWQRYTFGQDEGEEDEEEDREEEDEDSDEPENQPEPENDPDSDDDAVEDEVEHDESQPEDDPDLYDDAVEDEIEHDESQPEDDPDLYDDAVEDEIEHDESQPEDDPDLYDDTVEYVDEDDE